MKNADRINFYISGLRQPGSRPAMQAEPAILPATSEAEEPVQTALPAPAQVVAQTVLGAGESPVIAKNGPTRESLPADASFRDILLTTEVGQQVLALDQAQLHRLLQRLDHGRQRAGEAELSPAAARRKQRQLILGLVLAGIIIAVQATTVIWLYQRAELLLGRPLSTSLLLTATAGDLNVTFRPSASAGDVAVLLRELDLHVVDGPDTASRYVLRPDVGSDSARMLNALRDRRDLVYSADPAY